MIIDQNSLWNFSLLIGKLKIEKEDLIFILDSITNISVNYKL